MAETNQIPLPLGANTQAPPPLGDTTQTLQNGQHQRTAPLEATRQEKPVGTRGRGRRKVPMLRVNDNKHRVITFSKRRAGIYKKATEIGTLCGIDIGILVFSPAGKAYAYGVPNIKLVANRLLRGVNPDAQNGTLTSMNVNEAQRRANVGKLINKYDEFSVYLQNLKEEENKLKETKKQTLDDCWWDIPVADLTAVQMQNMTTSMEELKKRSSMRLSDLRAGASSSLAVVQPEDIQMGMNEGFGYVGDGGFGDLREGGSSSAVGGVQGGAMKMGGNIGQHFGGGAGDSGRFGDWRAGSSTAAGIQGSGVQRDGNGGLGALGVASSSLQAGGMQMRGSGVNGYGGAVGCGFGALTVRGSSSASIQQGGMQVGGYGEGGFGDGNVADGGIGKWRPVGSTVASSAVQPSVGSTLVGGNLGKGYAGSAGGSGGFGDRRAGGSTAAGIQMSSGYSGGVGAYFTAGGSAASSIQQRGMQMREFGGGGSGGIGHWRPIGLAAALSAVQPSVPSMLVGGNGGVSYAGGVAGGGGLSEGWKPINSSSTFIGIQDSNPMQIGRNGGIGNLGGGAAGGHGNWRSVGSSAMEMGGAEGFGHNNDAGGSTIGGAGRGLGGWGAGGASSSSSLQPNPMQMGGNGGLHYGGFGGGAGSASGGGSVGFGDFAAGSSAAAALHPDEDQMGGTATEDPSTMVVVGLGRTTSDLVASCTMEVANSSDCGSE